MKLSQLLLVVVALFNCTHLWAQPSVSGAREVTDHSEKTKAKLRSIADKAGVYFKSGLINLKDQRRLQARDDFDKAVRAFLESGISVRDDSKLQECYDNLIETIYRIEFPSTRTPQIKELAATCRWTLDSETESLAALLATPKGLEALTGEKPKTAPADAILVAPSDGFRDQKFEVSPLDQLAKLELTDEDIYRSYQTGPATVIKAQNGDTYEKIADRFKVSAVDLARANYSYYTDIPLKVGREIRIPEVLLKKAKSEESLIGTKPIQQKDGKVKVVMDYFNENFHDPYTMKFLRWWPIKKGYLLRNPYWIVTVKFRAKNTLGAYVLSEGTFYIRKNKIVSKDISN